MSSPVDPSSIMRILMLSYSEATGKTSLVSRFVNDTFSEAHVPTTGDIQSKTIVVDGEPITIQILDTSGDPNLSEVAVQSMKFADAFMVVYDASQTNLASCLPLRYSIIQEKQASNPPMVLVGNKSDLKRQTRRESGIALAEAWGCPFLETSARDNINVEAAFVQLVREYRARRRTFVHERKLTSFFSNAFPRLRTWDSTETYGRVLKSGWLHKRGLLRQNWKFRHIVIYDDGSLQYFHDENDEIPLGEFNLRDVWQIVDYREDGHEDAFVLQTKDRDWYFSCLSPSEKDGWLNVIIRLIADFSSKKSTDVDDRTTLPSESDMFFEQRPSLSPTPSSSSSQTTLSSITSDQRLLSDREMVLQSLKQQGLLY